MIEVSDKVQAAAAFYAALVASLCSSSTSGKHGDQDLSVGVFMSSSVGRFVKGSSFAAAAATPRVDVEKDPHAAAPAAAPAAACTVSCGIDIFACVYTTDSGRGPGYHFLEAIKFHYFCGAVSGTATTTTFQEGQGKCGHTFPPGFSYPICVTWTRIGYQAINGLDEGVRNRRVGHLGAEG